GGPRSYYGGTDASDNSGNLQYVRIEFAGYPFQPNKEINGLTFGGVGNGTTIDHIQVSYANDDSYEWFGGTVNVKHIIAFRGLDDEFDTDNGFSGKLQYLVALRDSAVADISGSNGFESDNDATGSTNTPYTSALFANVGIYGPKVNMTNPVNPNFKRAMHIRRNSRLSCYNSVFAGWPTGLYIDGDLTDANANNNDLQIENCIMTGMGKFFDVPTGLWTVADARSYYFSAARHNDTLATNNLLQITDPFNYNAPNFLPLTGSPVLGKALWTNPRLASDPFFDKVTYAGPMGTTDWTSPWANWDPQHALYALSVNENALAVDRVNVYPNPASGSTSVDFNLTNDEKVKIEVIDLSGRTIMEIQNGSLSSGQQHITFDASSLPTGAYFVRISVASSATSKKLFICR
ncbi:MAG: T9SS type A sorting domain-containing protein, partial [Bacteroidota bacterium]